MITLLMVSGSIAYLVRCSSTYLLLLLGWELQVVVKLAFGLGKSEILSCHYKFGATADMGGNTELILPRN